MSRRPAEDQAEDPLGGPWYRRWFGEAYLELYPHRDEEEAGHAVQLLLDHGQLGPGASVLDLACGAGRHLRSLREHGLHALGLDLSSPLLLRAKALAPEERLVRADMRVLPFASDRFSAVTSFFTSFGYFASDDDDRQVLSEIRRVLRRGGCLLLDFLNADRVRETLTARDEREVDGRRVVQERRLVDGGRAVEKTIRIERGGGREPELFQERVRLYPPGELSALLIGSGLTPDRWFGDYQGRALSDSAPRVIALAHAS